MLEFVRCGGGFSYAILAFRDRRSRRGQIIVAWLAPPTNVAFTAPFFRPLDATELVSSLTIGGMLSKKRLRPRSPATRRSPRLARWGLLRGAEQSRIVRFRAFG